MTNSTNPRNGVQSVISILENKQLNIRLKANGGNSVLFVCDPRSEKDYIDAIREGMSPEKYSVVDLNDLLIQFIDTNKDILEQGFQLLQGSPLQIFKAPPGEVNDDYFTMIIEAITDCFKNNKIPVVVNTGVLYGSGIDNIHLMENEKIMSSPVPLVILYPATKTHDNYMYLSKRPASKYRCMIIE